MNVIGDVAARLELVEMLSGLFDGDRSFEVTFHAHGIPTNRRKFRWIDNWPFAIDMLLCWSVTALAADSALCKRSGGESVLGAGDGYLHTAGVAVQTVDQRWQVHRDLV